VWRGKFMSAVRGASQHLRRGALLTTFVASVAVAGTTAWRSLAKATSIASTAADSTSGRQQSDGALASPPPATPISDDPRIARADLEDAFRDAVRRYERGATSRAAFRHTRDIASRIIERGPAGSRALIPMRFIRAKACVLGGLDCDARAVREDLTWVLASGSAADRREAVRMLSHLGGELPPEVR
jgi:hypothetical protein